MAVSTISGMTYGSTSTATRLPTTACPTCGGDNARTSTARAFSGGTYTGRGTDAFVCATCGQQRSTVASANSTTVSRTSVNSASPYCSTCGNNSPVNSGLSRAVYSGASQTSGTSNTYGRVSCATCSSAASRVAAANVNTISWAR